MVAGCAFRSSPEALQRPDSAFWSGRLALQVDSQPPEAFSASFELRGSASAGELKLFTPLGSTFAALFWGPGEARLVRGGEVRTFDSVETLAEAATGAAFPVTALFAWLAGDQAVVAGWRADLSRLDRGRLAAQRDEPRPAAQLKLVLEQP